MAGGAGTATLTKVWRERLGRKSWGLNYPAVQVHLEFHAKLFYQYAADR